MDKTLEQIPVVLVGPEDVPSGMVPAVLRELEQALEALMQEGTRHVVDLSTLPMSNADRSLLESTLGEGELRMELDVLGRTRIRESSFPGIWWVRHEDPGGKVLAEHIEVAHIPEIVPAHASDLETGKARLSERIKQISPGSER